MAVSRPLTPLHARAISLDGAPVLGPDVVAWVAGPAHSFTEVSAGSDGTNVWALLPIERDATHFGLATVALGSEPSMDAPVAFFDYPNGVDLAPVATAHLCGKTYVVLARPAAPAPRSPQELVMAPIAGGETAVLANASGFAAVSLSSAPGGGLVAYVADGRTWARAAFSRSPDLTSAGSRPSRTASTPQGPGFSTRRKERTVDAVPAIESPRSSAAVAQR